MITKSMAKLVRSLARLSLVLLVTAIVSPLFEVSPAAATDIDLDNLDWSVQVLIDNSADPYGVGGVLQTLRPRDNRGLAMSPDGQFLYAGYNNGPEVRRIDLTKSGNVDPFDERLEGPRGKAIATDDMGRVYLAEGSSSSFIDVWSPDLLTSLGSIDISATQGKSEGLALAREGGNLFLYTSDRSAGTLNKRMLSEAAGGGATMITAGTLDSTFGTAGSVTLAAGQDMRGVEVDGSGRIWAAGFGNDTIYRVSADGTTVDSIGTTTRPFDIGFDGDNVLVTSFEDRFISRWDANTLASLGADFTADWGIMGLEATGENDIGALSGIVVVPGVGFYVANEAGATLPFTETEGPDIGFEVSDNDPVLFASSVSSPGGDFDSDGDIDGADFLEWQRNMGVGSLSDWESGFGTSSAAANVSGVPEPTTAALAIVAACLLLVPGRLGRNLPSRTLA